MLAEDLGDSLKWKIIWSFLFLLSLRFPPFNIVYPVIMVIGIPIVNKFVDINRRFQ